MLININSVTVSEGHIQLSSMYLDEHDGESIQESGKVDLLTGIPVIFHILMYCHCSYYRSKQHIYSQ